MEISLKDLTFVERLEGAHIGLNNDIGCLPKFFNPSDKKLSFATRVRQPCFFLPLRNSVIMNNISSTRSTMRSMESESLNIVKGTSVIMSYLNGKSVLYSAMCGFPISRAAVILCNLIATLALLAALVAESSLTLAFVFAACAAALVGVLNGRKEAKDGNE